MIPASRAWHCLRFGPTSLSNALPQRPRPTLCAPKCIHIEHDLSNSVLHNSYITRRKRAAVIARRPQQTNPHDILDTLRPLPGARHPATRASDAVILVSRGFAHWLDNDDTFLGELLNRLFPPSGTGQDRQPTPRISVLLAAVDRIPAPSYAWRASHKVPTNDLEASRSLWSNSAAINDVGFEGIAYFVDTDEALLRYAKDHKPRAPPLSEPRPADIINESSGSILFKFDGARYSESVPPASIEIVLANTIFTNGRRRVLSRSAWERKDDSSPLNRTQSADLTNAVVTMHVGAMNRLAPSDPLISKKLTPRIQEAAMTIPLRPLTPPRIISALMGNVIRGIKDAEHGASKELEDAVMQHFVDQGTEPQTADVWALVVPKGVEVGALHLESLEGRSQGHIFSQSPSRAIWRGASLRRVQSGGGGWGSKAGLLSLDPEDAFGAEMPSPELDQNAAAEEDALPWRLVRDIAVPGDSIQFFIAPDVHGVTAPEPQEGDLSRTRSRLSSLDFGVIPNTDDGPWESPVATGSDAANIETFQGHFGALSETGIGLVRFPRDGEFSRSRISVPFSRFKFQRLVSSGRKRRSPSVGEPTSVERGMAGEPLDQVLQRRKNVARHVTPRKIRTFLSHPAKSRPAMAGQSPSLVRSVGVGSSGKRSFSTKSSDRSACTETFSNDEQSRDAALKSTLQSVLPAPVVRRVDVATKEDEKVTMKPMHAPKSAMKWVAALPLNRTLWQSYRRIRAFHRIGSKRFRRTTNFAMSPKITHFEVLPRKSKTSSSIRTTSYDRNALGENLPSHSSQDTLEIAEERAFRTMLEPGENDYKRLMEVKKWSEARKLAGEEPAMRKNEALDSIDSILEELRKFDPEKYR